MTFEMTAAIASVGTVAAGWAATQPLDLQRFRWLRIFLSLPLVIVIVSLFCGLELVRGFFGLWSFVVLGFLWANPMAHGGSWLVQRIIYGDLNRATGVRADFSGAKALGNHGDFAEAIALTEAELEKDPTHYEGLLLLSELYRNVSESHKAIETLERLLRSPQLTEEQREGVRRLHSQLADAALVAELNSR